MTDRFGSVGVRERAVPAVRALADAGGYDAVQIRDLVRLTGMSSATLYRHFSSRDQLIIAAFMDWIQELEAAPPAASGLTRVQQLVQLTCAALTRSPNFGKAVIRALGSTEPGVEQSRREATGIIDGLIRAALADEPVDPDEFLLFMGSMWLGALQSWAQDRFDMATVERLLSETAELLLRSLVRV
jgi:AcrR family transcriptional regulator